MRLAVPERGVDTEPVNLGVGKAAWEVVRGGSWNNNPDNARATHRNDDDPDNRNNKRGPRSVASFDYHVADRLLELQHELRTAAYRPGPYVQSSRNPTSCA